MNPETKVLLSRLVEKATILESYSFVEQVKERGLNIRGVRQEDGTFMMDFAYPDDESRDAFLLTFRFFHQRNETISFYRIPSLFSNPDLSDKWKAKAKKLCDAYFDLLLGHDDSYVNAFEGRPNRGLVVDTVIYGGIAHSNNPSKMALFQQWTENELKRHLLFQAFTSILVRLLTYIKLMRQITEVELKTND